jgi:aspartate-semialdehyde dehydrogenase
MLEDGATHEEWKIGQEVQKIVSRDIKIAVTSVRVPVLVGHGIALAVQFAKACSLQALTEVLSHSPSVKLCDQDYLTPYEVEGKDDVYVGRVRKDPSVRYGVLLWLVSDNLRRGAALDAVEIAERVIGFKHKTHTS